MANQPARRPAGWGRALSAGKVRRTLGIGQRWEDRAGQVWLVGQIWRKDGRCRLERPQAPGLEFPTFKQLGREYRLLGRAER